MLKLEIELDKIEEVNGRVVAAELRAELKSTSVSSRHHESTSIEMKT